jgi:hypothetical protein
VSPKKNSVSPKIFQKDRVKEGTSKATKFLLCSSAKMLNKYKPAVNSSNFISSRDFMEGYYFVTTLLTSIYASMLACIIIMLLRMIYVAVLRRLQQPRTSSNQV